MAEWIFDRGAASGRTSGANQTEKLFSGQGSLVKEGIQNAVDKISNANLSEPGEIIITLHELTGSKKATFLKDLQWQSLKKHVGAACIDGPVPWQLQMVQWYNNIENSAEPLRLLIFSDYGPEGLKGNDDFDEKSDFMRLCRSEHSTDLETATRSGSKGLGKAVFWKNSGINTVIFGSLTKKNSTDEAPNMRLFGQSLISSHIVEGKKYQPSGFFGELGHNEDAECTVSIWDNHDLAQKLMLDRNPSIDKSGTSVMVVDYRDEEHVRSSGEEIITSLCNDVEKWFWPALSAWNKEPAIVSIKLRFCTNLEEQCFKIASPENYKEFRDAVTANPTASTLSNPGDMAADDNVEAEVLKIHRDQKTAVKAKIGVRLTALSVGTLKDELRNTVALLRNLTMVIQYEPIKFPLSDGIEACGVVATGYAHGKEASDVITHDFLRQCEPPAHDSWKYSDDIKHIRGAQTKRDNFIANYQKTIKQLSISEVGTTGRPVDALGAMLRFHGKGKVRAVRKVFLSETSLVSRDPKKGQIIVSFKLNFNTAGTGPWSRKLMFKIKGPIQNNRLKVLDYSDISGKCRAWNIDSDGLTLKAEASTFVDGEVTLLLPDFANKKDVSNLAIDITIQDIKGA
jgi:hypothetical protein